MTVAPIGYARSGDVHVAYRELGRGPVDLVYVAGSFSHLDVAWELPAFRRLCEQVAGFCRLILFDKRGMGLSDRVRAGTLDERMDDVRAVMDAVGSQRAYLLGESEGGPLSMLFAAAHPERTLGLILSGAEVKERISDDWPWGECTQEELDEAMESLPERWGSGAVLSTLAPSLADDPSARAWLGKLLRSSASPSEAEAFMRMAFDIDVRSIVPAISVPTLILHRTGDRVCHVENARFLSAAIPAARYVELPGEDHVLWADGEDLLREIREFITGFREPHEPDRVLATILFTDIVDSTRRAEASGDRRWRDLVEHHHRLIRQELARYRGREIDTAGDGFLAAFDGPARALRAAASMTEVIQSIGLEIRVGVHTGECEVMGEKLVGIAVNIGARVAALAGPSQVLTTGTVHDLVAGSGVTFSDLGRHQLKGVPGEWQIFALTPPDGTSTRVT